MEPPRALLFFSCTSCDLSALHLWHTGRSDNSERTRLRLLVLYIFSVLAERCRIRTTTCCRYASHRCRLTRCSLVMVQVSLVCAGVSRERTCLIVYSSYSLCAMVRISLRLTFTSGCIGNTLRNLSRSKDVNEPQIPNRSAHPFSRQ